ncbi:calcium-binding protein, partial [Prosthecobacter sp.]|uniref:calcium-binding protein n=1 Tax=Prosthecobacter sp. TaxID=1965333 RepID=UPI0024888622
SDEITSGDGTKIVLGGDGLDTIIAGTGKHWVLGDNGLITYVALGLTGAGEPQIIETSDTLAATGGDDIITLTDGDSVVLGGMGVDTITTGSGNDTILGDNGTATYDSATGTAIISDMISTQLSLGGDDIISAGSGNNILIGGFGADRITSLEGDDIVAGDNAHAVFSAAGILTFFTSISPEIGGDDIIDAGDGNNIVLGGLGADTITTGTGADLLIGDNGNATFTTAGILTFLTTSDHTLGGNDTLRSGAGDDLVFGGAGSDYIDGGEGNDTLIGDNGYYSQIALLYLHQPRGIILLEENVNVLDGRVEGDDIILGGAGNDIIYGEGGADSLDGGSGDDTIFGGADNDLIQGGLDNDTLLGGAGYDFLDGGYGSDTLYVDDIDGWAGGMPEDTIIGGPFFSTNSQLSFGMYPLGYSSGASTPLGGFNGLDSNTETSMAETLLIILGADGWSGESGFEGGLSTVLSSAAGEGLSLLSYNLMRWGGSGQSFVFLIFGNLGGLPLAGIGDFIEALWSDLLVLMNG